MPRYDFVCPICKFCAEAVLKLADLGVQPIYCSRCRMNGDHWHVMDRLPSAPAFSISGYSAANGYSK